MTEGTIAKLLNYYFSQPHKFGGELECAHAEFFDGDAPPSADGMALEWFAQWFVYEYRFSNGKSVLTDFCERNPLRMKSDELEVYRALEGENEFGFFEVKEVRLNEGMMIESLLTGKTFWVKEKKGTHGARAGITILGRVGRVGSNMELLGNFDIYPLVFEKQAKGALTRERLDPKKYYHSKHLNDGNPSPYFAPEDAWQDHPDELLRQLEVSLDKCGILPLADSAKILSWIKKNPDTITVVGVVFGLLADNTSKADGEELMELLSACISIFSQKDSDRSTTASGMEASDDATDKLEMHTFGGAKWAEAYYHGLKLMRDGDAPEAIEEYEKAFNSLIDEKTTTREVYRLFANTGVAHFMIGDTVSGKQYLDMALTFHPQYEFALMIKERHEQGGADPLRELSFRVAHEMRRADKAAMKKKRAESAASRYFAFIKKFNINFSAIPTNSYMTTSNFSSGEKKELGRNDSCLCGATKADGSPVKYKHCHGK